MMDQDRSENEGNDVPNPSIVSGSPSNHSTNNGRLDENSSLNPSQTYFADERILIPQTDDVAKILFKFSNNSSLS